MMFISIFISIATSVECSICQHEMSNFDRIRVLSCRHEYHNECINNWLTHASNCPLCRARVPRQRDRRKQILRYALKTCAFITPLMAMLMRHDNDNGPVLYASGALFANCVIDCALDRSCNSGLMNSALYRILSNAPNES